MYDPLFERQSKAASCMNDLELLKDMMDKLNVYYSTEVDSDVRTLLTLEEDPLATAARCDIAAIKVLPISLFLMTANSLRLAATSTKTSR